MAIDYEELIQRSDNEADAGRTESARRILTEGLKQAERRGETAYVHLLRAELAYSDERYAEALDFAREALREKPLDHLILRHVGVYSSLLGRAEEAIEYFDQALQVLSLIHI